MGKIITTLLATICLHSPAGAQETKGLDISLISENRTITPGSTFSVGLHIHHHPGFHTYWKNPGIVGMATAIEWQLPPGFKASQIQWPYPELTTMASHPCHGYERDVTLLVKITAPKTIPTKNITLTAKTRWMCCAKDCHPGFRNFSITLPVSKQADIKPSTSRYFQKTRSELPRKTSPWEVSLLSKQDDPVIRLRLIPNNHSAPTPEYLFSEDGQISSNLTQTFAKQANQSYLFTIARSEFSPEHKGNLPAVIKAGKNHYFISPSYPKSTRQQP